MANKRFRETEARPHGEPEARLEFPFTSDAGFKRAMKDEEICKQVISAFTGLAVESVKSISSEYSLSPVLGGRGTRLDVLVQADGRLVNVEMQRADPGEIARRMRYYQAVADTHTVGKGSPYAKLVEHIIVFACTFDPLGCNIPRYTFHMQAEEAPEALFDPGFAWILLNSSAWAKEQNSGLRCLLRYMDSGTAEGELCRRIDAVLLDAHEDGLWKEGVREMMTVEQRIDWAEHVGEKRGLEKGLAEGRAEGMAETAAMYRWLSEGGRTDELMRSFSDPELQQRLLDEFNAVKQKG